MIDPAVLRPGRLDVKIRVDRPGIQQATQIVRHYLTDKLPLSPNVDAKALIGVLVNDIYAQDEHRHLCDICDDHGQWRPVYLADVVSRRGAQEHRGPCQNLCGETVHHHRTGCGESASICWPKPWTKNTVRPGTRCWMRIRNSGAASTGLNPDG